MTLAVARWMKNLTNVLQKNYYDVYTDYLVRYVEAFRERGVTVDALTMQNEPLNNGDQHFTMVMGAETAALLTNATRIKLDKAGLASTHIWAFDHNTNVPEYPQFVLDNTATDAVAAVAWHCYAPGGANWTALSAFHAKNPECPQFMTECWLHLATGEGFFDLPNFVIGPMQNYASGAIAWILGGTVDFDMGFPGRDSCGECSGLIQVNRSAGTYVKTQDYYTLGQFSKFVAKEALVLETNGNFDYPDGTGVQSLAFRNNGQLVVVIVNKITSDLQVNLALESGGGWNAQVEGSSVTTFVFSS